MIVIIGESGSGKSTLQELLVASDSKYKKLVTYTTRPMREGEVDGESYHFISPESFSEIEKRGFFAEYAEYRGWKYGTAKADCESENVVAVLTPSGMRTLKRLGYPIVSVYLYVDRRSRLISTLNRGDDIEECYRRNLTDVGQFDQIDKEADYVIENINFHMNPEQTLRCLQAILKVEEEKYV